MIFLKFSFTICLSIMCSLVSFAGRETNGNIIIESFDSIPSEIDGGCCVFYRYPSDMQNDGYIMVNDLANVHDENYDVKGNLIIEDSNKNKKSLSFCGNCSW